MRILCPGLLSVAAFGLFLFSLGGVSGCGGKPADGTMVEGAAPQTDEQKAMHKKFYTRKTGKPAKKAGRR